ncbi:hypothetical protein HaLaN_23528, partial [Haematococcus lacustris]
RPCTTSFVKNGQPSDDCVAKATAKYAHHSIWAHTESGGAQGRIIASHVRRTEGHASQPEQKSSKSTW